MIQMGVIILCVAEHSGLFTHAALCTANDINSCLLVNNYCFPAVFPSIENMINDEIRNQQENVTFSCISVGEPVPDITWSFNGAVIDEFNGYSIVSRSLNTTTIEETLTVNNVVSSDAGTYTCTSSNIIGSVTSSGILTVTSKLDT